jgi:hypothetical protein
MTSEGNDPPTDHTRALEGISRRERQRRVDAIIAEDVSVPYWRRRCVHCVLKAEPPYQSDYALWRKRLHTNFDCQNNRDVIFAFVKEEALPAGVPPGSLPPWLRKCGECGNISESNWKAGKWDAKRAVLVLSPMVECCMECRSCPPCSGCGVVERPHRSEYAKSRRPEWFCKSCSPWKQCGECRNEKPTENFARAVSGHVHHRCRACEYPTCSECGAAACEPVRENEKELDKTFICIPCQFPPCSGCGRRKRPQRCEY